MNKNGFTILELFVVVIIIFTIGGLVIGVGGGGCYGLLTQKQYSGTVLACNEMSAATYGKNNISSGTFSFAIDMSVQGLIDEILTFSSEDRKFANVVKGDSITVIVSQYAPWNFEKRGTYYGGRLIKKYKLK